METISPLSLDAKEWTDHMTPILERFGSIPHLANATNWRDWGAAVISMASLSGIVLPSPYDFVAFEEWAQRFNDVLDEKVI